MSEQATATAPTIRVRIAHASTVKEGWRCSETTIEWIGTGTPHWGDINGALVQAHVVGRAEADRRNGEPAGEDGEA